MNSNTNHVAPAPQPDGLPARGARVLHCLGQWGRAVALATLAFSVQPALATDVAAQGRYQQGLTVANGLFGEEFVSRFMGALGEVSPDLARFTIEYGYGDVVSRPGLGLCERELVTVAALTTLGAYPPLLKTHINGALQAGCKPETVVETILQMSVYAGFPASISAMTHAKAVFVERGILNVTK